MNEQQWAIAIVVAVSMAGCAMDHEPVGRIAEAIEIGTAERCSTRQMSTSEIEAVEAEIDTFSTSIGITPISPEDPPLHPPVGSHMPTPETLQPRTPFEVLPTAFDGIPVAFHVIHASDGTGDVPDEVLEEQLAVLNRSFDSSSSAQSTDVGISFYLRSIDRTENDDWFVMAPRSAVEQQANEALRVGGRSTLNIYVTTTAGLLGYAAFPWDYDDEPERDGVYIHYQSLPGNEGDYGLGDTATHEVGHWLGLYHTFQNGCDAPGDYIGDTPPQESESFGCPVGRNSCSGGGDDPIFNFMDYSDDACMDRFTREQASRMALNLRAFRNCSNNCIQIQFTAL